MSVPLLPYPQPEKTPMSKMLVYISGPYTAMSRDLEIANTDEAKRFGLQVRAAGAIDLVPHIAVNATPDTTWGDAMEICLRFLATCDAIFMMPNWEASRGARVERDYAKEWGLPIFYSVAELQAAVEKCQ